jgi:hypothetical protein
MEFQQPPSGGPPRGDPSADLAARKLAFEVEKLEAETAKAKADTVKAIIETERLKRPWYKSSATLQPLATIAIAAIAAIVGYSNGWFQTKLEPIHHPAL